MQQQSYIDKIKKQTKTLYRLSQSRSKKEGFDNTEFYTTYDGEGTEYTYIVGSQTQAEEIETIVLCTPLCLDKIVYQKVISSQDKTNASVSLKRELFDESLYPVKDIEVSTVKKDPNGQGYVTNGCAFSEASYFKECRQEVSYTKMDHYHSLQYDWVEGILSINDRTDFYDNSKGMKQTIDVRLYPNQPKITYSIGRKIGENPNESYVERIVISKPNELQREFKLEEGIWYVAKEIIYNKDKIIKENSKKRIVSDLEQEQIQKVLEWVEEQTADGYIKDIALKDFEQVERLYEEACQFYETCPIEIIDLPIAVEKDIPLGRTKEEKEKRKVILERFVKEQKEQSMME